MSSDSRLERGRVLRSLDDALAKQRVVAVAANTTGAIEATALDVVLREAVAQCADRYRSWLPRRALSRCPLTGALLVHSIDSYGLDGPWWNYDQPIRAMETVPPTFFALRGGLRLSRQIEEFDHLAVPGPEVPYVVPRLLNCEGVVAVVSTLLVGKHRAWPVCYFASPAPAQGTLNEWGSSRYRLTHRGSVTWHEAYEPGPGEMDFDLAPWISRGKLLWIAPNDEQYRLRSDLRGCPFIDLSGSRATTRMQRGRHWSDADVVSLTRAGSAR